MGMKYNPLTGRFDIVERDMKYFEVADDAGLSDAALQSSLKKGDMVFVQSTGSKFRWDGTSYQSETEGNIDSFYTSVGIINTGVRLLRSNTDLTLELIGGNLTFKNTSTNKIDQAIIPSANPMMFSSMKQDGVVVAANITDIDLLQYDNNGTLTNIPAGNDGVFHEFYVNTQGDIVMLYGQIFYASIGVARQTALFENKIIPSQLNGYVRIGGLIAERRDTNLAGANIYLVGASKFGELSAIGGQNAEVNLFNSQIIANTAQLTALPIASLVEGQAHEVENSIYVWKPTAATGQLEPDDKVSGNGYWVQASGDSSTTPTQISRESTFDATLVTHSGGGTYVANKSNPATGEVSVVDGKITRVGRLGIYHFELNFDQDSTFTLDFAAIMPAGGRIVKALPLSDSVSQEPYSDVNFNLSSTGTGIDVNRADSIDADVNYIVEMTVDGFSEFEEFTLPTSITYSRQVISGVTIVDIGVDREMRGVISSDGTVNFPAGGFADTPVVTFSPVNSSVREVRMDNVTSTSVFLRDGGNSPKHWIAKGLKP